MWRDLALLAFLAVALGAAAACADDPQEAPPDAASSPRRGATAAAVVGTPPPPPEPPDAAPQVCRLPGGVVCCLCRHPNGTDTCCFNLQCAGGPCTGECGDAGACR